MSQFYKTKQASEDTFYKADNNKVIVVTEITISIQPVSWSEWTNKYYQNSTINEISESEFIEAYKRTLKLISANI